MNQAALAALAIGPLCAAGALAQHQIFRFEGTITETTGSAPVQVGETFELRYRFNEQTPDTDPSPSVGQYNDAIVAWYGRIPDHFSFPILGDIAVLNNGLAGDTYTATAATDPLSIHLGLTDLEGTAFGDDGLPSGLTLNDFEIRQVSLIGPAGPATWEATGETTSFESVEFDCYIDCNHDGILTWADWGCFQTQFAVGNLWADCNGDGLLNLADFGCWSSEWAHATGCL